VATLEQRLQALESAQRVQLGQDLILVRIRAFGEDGQPFTREAWRVVSGAGNEWQRMDGESEPQFLERVKRAAGALGLKVLTVSNPLGSQA
jgi:hypothetical protein